jgi:hypothetical protein
LVAAVAALLVCLASAAGAAVLWDQSALDPNGNSIPNSKSPGFGGFTIYSVNDITVPASGWVINSISSYWSDWNYSWYSGGAPTGYLIIMPKTGSVPVGTPSTSTVVALTWVDGAVGPNIGTMTAGGLNVPLVPGDYWITVSPIGPAGIDGANLQWPSTTHLGSDVSAFDTGAWHAYNPGEDGAFKIEGQSNDPTPSLHSTWGSIKALYR